MTSLFGHAVVNGDRLCFREIDLDSCDITYCANGKLVFAEWTASYEFGCAHIIWKRPGSNSATSVSTWTRLQRDDEEFLHSQPLATKNCHPRDCRICLRSSDHTYRLDSKHLFRISVSGVVKKHFPPFDAQKIISERFDRWAAKPDSKYFDRIRKGRLQGESDATIKACIAFTWAVDGSIASTAGNLLHRQIEIYLNFSEDVGWCSAEMLQFQTFMHLEVVSRKWTVYRTEWSIFDEDLMLAGQIDCVFRDSSGKFHMCDWKRSVKELDPFVGVQSGRYGFGPCQDMLDNSFNRYVCQQNLYNLILRDCYSIQLESMWLVQMHEESGSYLMLSVPFLEDMARVMAMRACASGSMEEDVQHAGLEGRKRKRGDSSPDEKSAVMF